MATKTIRGYYKQRYDTLQEWMAVDPVLRQGELAVVVYTGEGDQTLSEPQVYIKSGDGTKKFSELPFLTAKAGDVYAWAKAATKPTYNASEIEDLADFIADTVEDTNTQYQIVQGEDAKTFVFQSKDVGDADWTDAFTLHIPEDVAYDIESTTPGKVTLTRSDGDPTEVTVVEIDETKEDITELSTKLPTSSAVAGYVKDAMNAASARVMRLRGSVKTVDDLPTDNLQVGDTYFVRADKSEYSWVLKIDDDGNEYCEWEELGKEIDLSDYATKDEVSDALAEKQDLIDEDHKLPSALVSGLATDTADGLMSKEDKAKLDELNPGGEANKIEKIVAGDQVVPIEDKTAVLAKIAYTGNIMDLIQDEEDIVILDGGNARGIVEAPSTLIFDGGNSATPRP